MTSERMIFRTASAAIVGVALLCAGAVVAEPPSLGFVKGHSWGWSGQRGEYAAPEAAASMQKLAETGADWVCISFATTQTTGDTPRFDWADKNPQMVSDDEVRQAIGLAKANRLKVILKPVVNCADVWRAWIKFYRPVTSEERTRGVTGELDPWGDHPVMRSGEVRDLQKWDQWWACYSAFLLHYAAIAQAEHVDMLCLGCEMSSTEEFEDRWRALIAEIRNVYHGALTYDVNHGREAKVPWWDAVDVIGVSAYYHVPPPTGQTEAHASKQTTAVPEIVAALQLRKAELVQLYARWRKPILFIETGCPDVRGCARHPWSRPDVALGDPIDEAEQANYYEAMFETYWDEPWFMGFTWWDWPARLYDRAAAAANRDFCVYGKQAEGVVRRWYAKPR